MCCDWYAKVANLQLLMIEIYKTKHSLNPTFIRDVFAERNNQHNLRNENHLRLQVAKTTTYGLETIEDRGCLLWSTLPPEIKDPKSLSEFKRKIKNGMEILASADYVQFMLEIWDFYNYRLKFFRLNIVSRFFKNF